MNQLPHLVRLQQLVEGVLTRYGAIGPDTGGEWVQIYVLPDLDFSLDPEALYNENKSILWNEEHAAQYQVPSGSGSPPDPSIGPVLFLVPVLVAGVPGRSSSGHSASAGRSR